MSWLSGFSKRLKLTISAASADSNLTNFPVMLNLSSSSGKTGFDTTAVFDELGDAHQKRFAITKNDGTTQCPVEIEYWDATEEKAILWTKIPTVYSSVDTDVFFYFDATVSGNTAYVGDVGDPAAQSVWDSNFKLVMHMAQDPNGDVADAIKDSTINANHGTPVGSMTTDDLVDGKIGKAIDFDSADDYIDCGSSTSLFVNVGLFEAYIRAESTQVFNARILSVGNPTDRVGLYLPSTTSVHFYGLNSPTLIFGIGATITADGATFHSIAGSWDTTEAKLYVDGVEEDSWSGDATLGLPATTPVFIGEYIGGGDYRFHGLIDEVRISNTARSEAWIKATYYSNSDNFMGFQQEELTTHYYYGYITEGNVPVSRTVRLYYRNTGELVSDTSSNADTGYYYLTTTISGEHFIVTIDDEVGEDYNALILDRLLPRGIE